MMWQHRQQWEPKKKFMPKKNFDSTLILKYSLINQAEDDEIYKKKNYNYTRENSKCESVHLLYCSDNMNNAPMTRIKTRRKLFLIYYSKLVESFIQKNFIYENIRWFFCNVSKRKTKLHPLDYKFSEQLFFSCV